MPIYALGDVEPTIHPEAFVHPDAVLIGDVRIGAFSTVWPCAVLRSDDNPIIVGERTSIQDGSVIHVTPLSATIIGDEVTVGHQVHMESVDVKNRALIGSGSKVLPGAVIGEEAIVGANAVVPGGMEVPPLAMALGVPAKIREGAVKPGTTALNWESYVERGKLYRQVLRRVD